MKYLSGFSRLMAMPSVNSRVILHNIPAPFLHRNQACDVSQARRHAHPAAKNQDTYFQNHYPGCTGGPTPGSHVLARRHALARPGHASHPLRHVHGAVQDARARALVAPTVDRFVGSELHSKLSLVHPYLHAPAEGIPQGSPDWLYARSKRVTASTVAKATGLLPAFGRFAEVGEAPQRTKLWMEMLGLAERFRGNSATKWGTVHESSAASTFHQFIDGHAALNHCAFDVLRGCDQHGRGLEWIGASPDGLLMPVQCSVGTHATTQRQPDDGRHPHSKLKDHKGILEIKCPYKLRDQQPYTAWPAYYLPQIQTNMAVFEAAYAYMMCWTPQGATVFYVEHDAAFWEELLEALSEFWFEHYLPAKFLKDQHERQVPAKELAALLQQLKPGAQPKNAVALKERSASMLSSIELVTQL